MGGLLILPAYAFDPRDKPAKPTVAATTPPIMNQTALSPGNPVKKFDISELIECEALTPKMIKTMPPIRNTIDMTLFINPSVKRCAPGADFSLV
jgi:hypothetical protein